MNQLYEGHLENASRGLELARIANAKLKEQKTLAYNANPNKCVHCLSTLPFEKRKNSFCSYSCRASHNNKKRGARAEETKKRISDKLSGRSLTSEHKQKCTAVLDSVRAAHKAAYQLSPKHCSFCKREMNFDRRHRRTCGRECSIQASTNRKYRNGSRKTFYYKDTVLESTWELELAKWLDEKGIEWHRPKPIKWNDGHKDRLYYPDFYLPSLDLYLDPKNPFCLQKDKAKMVEVSKKVSIVYVDLELIKSYLGRAV